IPADGSDLRNRLPADIFGDKLLRGPVPYAPKISIQVVPQLHPGFDGGIHGALLAGSRRNRPHWSRLCPKKGVWNSSLDKCSSFERLKVPDTFFWAKPSGSQAGKARPARQASGAAANRSESIPVAVPWRRFYPCPVVEPG